MVRGGFHTSVITLTLEDLHGYFFIYNALLRAQSRGSDEAPLRMFWGMPPPGGAGSSGDQSASAISGFFGQAGSPDRNEFITGVMPPLQVETFTQSQLDVLRRWSTNARVDCPPGCGKTLLAMALCVRILQSPVRYKVWVTQASLLQVDSFFKSLE